MGLNGASGDGLGDCQCANRDSKLNVGPRSSTARWATIASTIVGVVTLVGFGIPSSASATTVNFSYTGAAQQYAVPNSVDKILIHALGGQGGGAGVNTNPPQVVPGGLGGEAVAPVVMSDAASRLLQVFVGGQGGNGVSAVTENNGSNCNVGGFNGGGQSNPTFDEGTSYCSFSGAGGGASDVRVGPFGLANRLVVAGGGGGTGAGSPGGFGAQEPSTADFCPGGTGGGTNGGDATTGAGNCERNGQGGSQQGGGEGSGSNADNGALGTGGSSNPNETQAGGGGGGGGYYGGGAGGPSGDFSVSTGGAGGGSGFVPASGGTLNSGVNPGNGQVAITYTSVGAVQANVATTLVDQVPLTATGTLDVAYATAQPSFDLYGPNDPGCTGTPAFHDAVPVEFDGNYQSDSFTPTVGGRYRWVLSFPGDANNQDISSPCVDDDNLVTVAEPAPSPLAATPASPSNSTTPLISGSGAPGTTVSLYTASDCSGTPAASGPAATFISPGLQVSVASNSTTTFYGQTTSNGVTSTCSVSSVTYVNESVVPVVTLDTQTPAVTNQTSASFTYPASESGLTFQCKLDAEAFASCPADGTTEAGLADGSHTFSVQASDDAGNQSAVESFTWEVDTVIPQTAINSKPAAFTNSVSATFSYGSDKAGVDFECSLDSQPFTDCLSSGITYPGLTASPHTFAVRAADAAGNVGPAAAYSWTVDTTLPQPSILSQPPTQSNTASATFTYAASEQGSTFECSLDSQSFSSCPTAGITYTGLADGAHTFRVQATDRAGNTGSAATYGWTVSTVVPPTPTAKIGRVSVSGPARARKGRQVTTYKVKISNTGNATATGVKIGVTGGGIKITRSVGKIAAGKGKTTAIKLKPKRTGQQKITFRVTSGNAGGNTAAKKITVKR